MTIRNFKAYCDSVWNWGLIGDDLPPGVSIGDQDGILERRGRFLIIEGKPWGKPVAGGQLITFRKMVETRLFTILIIEGVPPDTPQRLTIWNGWDPKDGPTIWTIDPAGLSHAQEFIRTWWEQATLSPTSPPRVPWSGLLTSRWFEEAGAVKVGPGSAKRMSRMT